MKTRYERCVEYECAQELFNQLRAARSAWMHTEEQKPNPSAAQIETWHQEAAALYQEQSTLDASDDEAVATAILKCSSALQDMRENAL